MKKKITLRYVLADNVLKIVHKSFYYFVLRMNHKAYLLLQTRWDAHVTAENIASSSSPTAILLPSQVFTSPKTIV
jgi:hypothetical protein